MLKENPYVFHNCLSLHQTGEAFLDLLELLIYKAKETIHINMYILKEDCSGIRFAEALRKACQRGVKVYLLLDALGSNAVSKKLILSLEEEGVQVARYNPFHLKKFWRYLYRLHQKVILFDSETAIIGGFNIADEYLLPKNGAPWLDFASVIRGEVLYQVICILNKIFTFYFRQGIKYLHQRSIFYETNISARIVWNNILQRQFGITHSYKSRIHSAKHSIMLLNSYFYPGRWFLKHLKAAVLRGVKVRLIVPKKSDVWIMEHATRYLYSYLSKHGIEIYEWQPSMLHAKLAIVDDQWCTVGSYNLNDLSHIANIEMNLEIVNAEFVYSVRKWIDTLIDQGALQVTSEILKNYRLSISNLLSWLISSSLRFLSWLIGKISRKY